MQERIAQGLAGSDALRLRAALSGFDQVTIATIHGFCKRILDENAFESGARFDLRLVSDLSELIEDAAAEKMGASAKRHVVLLRLCLVMLRVGEERIGDAADGLDALSRLGAAWFPATPPDLCSRFLACEIRSKPIRAAARRHRRDRAREKRAKQGLPPRPPGALARLRALLSPDPGTTP